MVGKMHQNLQFAAVLAVAVVVAAEVASRRSNHPAPKCSAQTRMDCLVCT